MMAERYGRDGRLEQAEPAAGAVTPAGWGTRDRNAAERMGRYRARRRGADPLLFERPDWTPFTDPGTLPQKAGVPFRLLVRVALKEQLVDSAPDVGCRVDLEREGAWSRVTADDPGLDRAQIERLFRIDRPLVSGKLLRRPTRGMLGNGLRVAVGVVIASAGEMEAHSRGAGYRLAFHPDGSTRAVPVDAGGGTARTEVRVVFGPALEAHADDGAWAELAIALNGGRVYDGRSSPHWYARGAAGTDRHRGRGLDGLRRWERAAQALARGERASPITADGAKEDVRNDDRRNEAGANHGPAGSL